MTSGAQPCPRHACRPCAPAPLRTTAARLRCDAPPTCTSLAPPRPVPPRSRLLFDSVGGVADCGARRLRTIAPAAESFKQDPARILRGVRLAARAGAHGAGQGPVSGRHEGAPHAEQGPEPVSSSFP